MTPTTARQVVRLATAALLGTLPLPLPSVAYAQARKAELGTDAQLVFRRLSFENSGVRASESVTQLELPSGLRAGFFLSQRTSLELAMTLNYVKPSEGSGFTAITLGVGPMIHLSVDPTRSQGYVRPFLGVNYVNQSKTTTQIFFGGAVGIKAPAGRHAAMRYEAFALHANENGLFARETRFGFSVGFSVFFP